MAKGQNVLEYKEFYRRFLPHWQPAGATIFITYRLAGSLPRHILQSIEAEHQQRLRDAKAGGKLDAETRWLLNKEKFIAIDRALDNEKSGPHWLSDPRVAEVIVYNLHFHAERLYHLWAYVVMSNHVHVLVQPLAIVSQIAAVEVAAQSGGLGYVPGGDERDSNVSDDTAGAQSGGLGYVSGGDERDSSLSRDTAGAQSGGLGYVSGGDERDSNVSDDTAGAQFGGLGYAQVSIARICHALKSYTSNKANAIIGRTGKFWQIESYDHWIREDDEFWRVIEYIENNPVKIGVCKQPEDWRWSSAYKRKELGLDYQAPLPRIQ